MSSSIQPALREKIASAVHDMWAHWMRYMLPQMNIDPATGQTITHPGGAHLAMRQEREAVARWVRQMNTPYDELSEKEKDSDREVADMLIKAVVVPFEPADPPRRPVLVGPTQPAGQAPERPEILEWIQSASPAERREYLMRVIRMGNGSPGCMAEQLGQLWDVVCYLVAERAA